MCVINKLINKKGEKKMPYLIGLSAGATCMIGGVAFSIVSGNWDCFHFSCLVAAVAIPMVTAATTIAENVR